MLIVFFFWFLYYSKFLFKVLKFFSNCTFIFNYFFWCILIIVVYSKQIPQSWVYSWLINMWDHYKKMIKNWIILKKFSYHYRCYSTNYALILCKHNINWSNKIKFLEILAPPCTLKFFCCVNIIKHFIVSGLDLYKILYS